MRLSFQLILLALVSWWFNGTYWHHQTTVNLLLIRGGGQPLLPETPQGPRSHVIVSFLRDGGPSHLASVISLMESVKHPQVATIVMCHASIPFHTIAFLQRLGHQTVSTIVQDKQPPRPTISTSTSTDQDSALESILQKFLHLTVIQSGVVLLDSPAFLSKMMITMQEDKDKDNDKRKNENKQQPFSSRTRKTPPPTTKTIFLQDDGGETPKTLAMQIGLDTSTTNTDLGQLSLFLIEYWKDQDESIILCQDEMVECIWTTPFQDMTCQNQHLWNNNDKINNKNKVENAIPSLTRHSPHLNLVEWTKPLLDKRLTHEEQAHCRLPIAQRVRKWYFLALQRVHSPPLSANDLLQRITEEAKYLASIA